VVRAQGRKIIFSTNLPNLGDLDDALIRPGRCFARVHTRNLTAVERDRLLARLCPEALECQTKSIATLSASGRTVHSLAEIYQALAKARESGIRNQETGIEDAVAGAALCRP
jgi:ATP-dependent 26S proteasome regulatory subunit